MSEELIETIKKEFRSNVFDETVSNNEHYLTVRKEEAVRICDYLYHRLDFPLISVFATDERAKDGCFRIHYMFSCKGDTFIIIKIKVEETSPGFATLTHKIPASNWYEREIQDMF